MKKPIDERIYNRIVEQAPHEMWESEIKQEGTIVLRGHLPADAPTRRLVHQDICGCAICRRYFPQRAKTIRLLEPSS